MERQVSPSDNDPASGPRSSLNRPAEGATPNPQIERYLDRAFAPLHGRVAPFRIEELRMELRAHLESLAQAHEELGSTPEQAVRATLEQMGDARLLSQAWSRECVGPTETPRSILGVALLSAQFLASAGFSAALLVTFEHLQGHNLFELLLGGPMIPLAAGFAVGLLRGRHPLGSRAGLLLIALAGLGVSLLMSPSDPRPPVALLIRVLMWTWSSCSTAGLGALIDSWKARWRPSAAMP